MLRLRPLAWSGVTDDVRAARSDVQRGVQDVRSDVKNVVIERLRRVT
jgi:hypothetical protein